MVIIVGGGYAKLKERQGSKEFLDPGTASPNKMSPDGTDEGLMAESKGEQKSSTTTGRQSVGLLAGTARLMKRAVATADRYKQFIDADVDTEAAPITSSDCDADGHSDESRDADESKLSHESRPDFQYTKLDDPVRHSMKHPVPSVCTSVTAVTTVITTTGTHQPAFQSRKGAANDGRDKRAVRQRPPKPDFSALTSSANPFSLGKVVPPLSYDSSTATNSASLCCDKMDVFGAAPFHRKALGPAESKTDSANNVGEIDVFANVPFVRQQERIGKAASSVSPSATSSKVASVPNPAASIDGGSHSTFAPAESYSVGSLHVTSAIFHQSSSGPMSASYVPTTESFGGSGQMNVVSTLSSAVQPCGLEIQEMNAYAQQDSGALLASPLLPVAGKGPHTVRSGTVASECLDTLSCGSKASSYPPVLPSVAGQSLHEEPQSTEECVGTGSLKRGWLAKLCSEKESPTTAVANLGFSDDPDAMISTSALPAASDLSFHEDVLDAMAEPKSPAMAGELNFLLPSGEGSHSLPKVSVKKHLSHQHRVPPMPPETDSFSVTKKGIALL